MARIASACSCVPAPALNPPKRRGIDLSAAEPPSRLPGLDTLDLSLIPLTRPLQTRPQSATVRPPRPRSGALRAC